MPKDQVVELLYRVGGRLASYGNQAADGTGLRFSQLFLLYEMLRWRPETDGALSVSALAKKLGFSKSSICTTVQALKGMGYLTQNVSGSDSRKKEIALTPKARACEAAVAGQMQALDARLCTGLSRQALEAVRHALFQIVENMQQPSPQAP